MKKFLFFGDSVTESGRDKTNACDLGHGYVYFLSQVFNDINFINKGIGGQRVKDLINRLDDDVIKFSPDVCFILIGVNDAWLPYMLNQASSLHTFKADFEELIKSIINKLEHVEIVLIKPYALPIDKSNDDVIKDLSVFRDDYETVAKKYSLPILDMKDTMEKSLALMPAESLFYDGIHPTKLGHQIISQMIENYIKGHLYDL
ncbi:MAG: hypothetical protein K8Q99_07495 [Acholeplasmataceae bacterium]|nr:hypothetical protein [Acholeplasmataceae bacterium]